MVQHIGTVLKLALDVLLGTTEPSLDGCPVWPTPVSVPDDRTDYATAEVAVDYNALYTVALAAAMALGDSEFWANHTKLCGLP